MNLLKSRRIRTSQGNNDSCNEFSVSLEEFNRLVLFFFTGEYLWIWEHPKAEEQVDD